jgi:2'-5' RNA ligase
MPEARWVEPERFHLTLRFIGAVDDAMAHDIEAALQRIEASPFALTLAGVGHFHAHSLWAGVTPSRALMCLQDKVEQVLRAIGLPVDDRPYVPHVKLARLRRRTSLRTFLSDHGDFRAAPFEVRQFSLIERQRRDSRTVIGTSPITRWFGTRPDSDAVRGASGQRPWRGHKKDAIA